MKTLLLFLTMLMISSLSFGQLTFRELKKAINKNHRIVTPPDTSKTKVANAKTASAKVTSLIDSTSSDTSTNTPKANTDFILPDVGQKKLNLIFTPTFTYNKSYGKNDNFGITGTFFGNSIGTDSSLQAIGNKFLIPQASMIGTKVDFAFILFDSKTDNVKFGPVGEVNFLWKKVSYIDTLKADAIAGKVNSTNFTPFVIHSKVGFTAGFFDANITVTGYLNCLWVTTENNNFSKLFNTNKSFLIYPELNTTMAFDLGDSSKQTIKVGIDMIYNNSDAQILSNSHDKIIPYLKVGFASSF